MTYANTETAQLGYVHSQYPRVSHGYTCIETTMHKLSVHISSYGGSEHNFAVLDAATVLPFTLI